MNWATIRVPANWYLSGYDFSGIAWYSKTIEPLPTLADAIDIVEFEGVDYLADVWMNGSFVGSHEGYFGRFWFDVTPKLRSRIGNRLTVKVSCPTETPGTTWSLHKRQIKGVLNNHDTRPGGAWTMRGQERSSGGIWQSVRMHRARTQALTQLTVNAHADLARESALVSISLDTYSRYLIRASRFHIQISPANFTGPIVNHVFNVATLPAGRNKVALHITLPHAALWWPTEFGAQNLYNIEVEVIDKNGQLRDRVRGRFAVRTVQRDPVTGLWSVNGQRLFLRGTNHIGTHWLAELDRTRARGDLTLMQHAHINAVGVHAHVATQAFYDVADELGMLLWQDFPLQWGYQDDVEFHDKAIRQSTEMVTQLFNHPAIFAWSMHNEPPWDAA